ARSSSPRPRRRAHRPCRSSGARAATLALGELRRLARLVQPGLLALHDPGVARQEAGALQRLAQVRVSLDERAADAVTDCSGLAGGAAAVHADADVEGAFDAGDLERRQGQLAVGEPREVVLDRLAVEPGRAVARPQDHARDRGLALAGPLVLRDGAHSTSSGAGACASCGWSGPA